MISKLLINIDNKLILSKFKINKIDNKIIISFENDLIKIPIYNKYIGLDYYTITMPLELIIYNNSIFNPYLILSLFNDFNENEFDFFNNLLIIINNKYNLKFLKLTEIQEYHINNYLNDNIKNNIWLKINILKLLFIYNFKNNKKSINYDLLFNELNSFKYNLYENDYNIKFNFNEWNNNINNKIKLNKLLKNNYYYIENVDKNIMKIQIIDINNNNILLSNKKKILYGNYNWYYFYNNNIDKNFLIYNFFINNDIKICILKWLNIAEHNNIIKYEDVLNYYTNDFKLSNNMTLNNQDEMSIIESNSFTNTFFKDICEKYYENKTKIFEIIKILFNNYNYPLKINRNELDNTFDHILYITLYNYKIIFVDDIINQSFLDIIPSKLKNLYLNIMKVLINIINNNFNNITYNQKYYNDFLHRNIIKLFLLNSNKISIELFKKIVSEFIYLKFKNIFSTNLLLHDISYKLSWNTLSVKLNYLNIFYKNSDIVFFQNKINKNIIYSNIDNKIKKIIENPFEMYKYLNNEKDFIKWSTFISNKLDNLYYIPIIFSRKNLDMIYLLFNINEQNIKNITYINFINFCINNSHLILNNTRINLKIKENFNNLKCNINLGYLAKDLILNKNIIITDINNDSINNNLEYKLKIAIKKYLKYKGKYLKIKNNNKIHFITRL